ncbi:bifunctional adenosylcobinamide kinase/adenosylcobinamide-phosphate guanylyltransferase [Bacillus massilinigeriensis]|uniref:bifunctional adenosylcobinamide kinase/adenosylcobinamide-phosphate guanylyltransferase n=1 Tax=Bacillus mediterraneensis TaxID=1805474 RepID=UPI0008F837B2|nr:bifunctional adenosylcobinamide kinase/adenosylcobinamide-phosphate guanylyltransferase [Bacillus mediterraneensis]
MHFVTGGCFNGKGQWVKSFYQFTEENCIWVSAYKGEKLLDSTGFLNHDAIVLVGIELWLRKWSMVNPHHARERWKNYLHSLLEWEKSNHNRKAVVIASDITKGIVPASKEDRNWRDAAGWVYQETVAKSERTDLIMYGLNKRIK